MSLANENSNGMVMPVSPMYGGYNNGGFDGLGGDGGWWLLLLLFALGGNWGGFGGFGGNEGVLPYMWNTATQNDVNRGFDTAAISSQLSGIQSSINNGFASAEVAECNRAMDSMQTAYNNQIASMNQNFTMQSQLQQCCCDNRAGLADVKYTIATENCADRAAVNEGVRDIIANQTASTQAILDKLCQQEIDALKTQNDNLRSQLNMATLRESQTAQNAFISQGFANEVDQLYNRLNNCPVPTTPVYGRTPIFTCNNNGCGCGCGNNF